MRISARNTMRRGVLIGMRGNAAVNKREPEVLPSLGRGMRSRLLVVIPARDEAATVGRVVRDVRRQLGCAVVVVDDASQDQTAVIARKAGATVLSLPFSLGAWGATQAGLRWAYQEGFDSAVTMDADGQHHAHSVARLIAAIEQDQTDVAVGACPQRLSRAKRVAWAYFRALTHLQVKDFTSGLRAYNHRALAILTSKHASLLDYQDVGVLMLLRKYGLRSHEVAVQMSPRTTGHSRVFSSWFVVARYMIQTTVLCVARVGARRGPRQNPASS